MLRLGGQECEGKGLFFFRRYLYKGGGGGRWWLRCRRVETLAGSNLGL